MATANTERDAKIAAAARLGQTHDAIAREHGLTRARVSQIVAAAKTPVTAEEAQRQLIAERLRSRWDELEKIVQNPPVRTTSIGRTQWDPRTCTCPTGARTDQDHDDGCKVQPVLDMATVTAAIKTQLAVEAQFRQMFGVDLGTRPGPIFDERQVAALAEIRAIQNFRNQIAPLPALGPLPDGYASMTPAEQARAEVERRRAAIAAQQAVIRGEVISG